jgi:hypothetical protein
MNRQRTRVLSDVTWFNSPEPIVAVAWGPRGLYYSTPGAVRLFELTRQEDEDDSGDPGSPSPQGAMTPVPGPSSDTPVGLLLFGGAAAVLTGALLYAFGGKKRGRT